MMRVTVGLKEEWLEKS